MDELRTALELASEEELSALGQILFQPRFNPLDYFCAPDPTLLQRVERQQKLDLIESRFRFLAADGFSVLNRRCSQITYRQVLLQVCQHLKVSHREDWTTEDIEAEIFLHLTEHCWNRLSVKEQQLLQKQLSSLMTDQLEFKGFSSQAKLNPVGLILKGGSAFAVTSVIRPWILRKLAVQFSLQLARYEMAKRTIIKSGLSTAAGIGNQMALQTASRGMAISAARYGATRSLLAWVGPLLWGWFLADLGWRAISTNYGRIIPAIFTLAQIRLTRSTSPAYC